MRIRPGACVPFVAVVGHRERHDAAEGFPDTGTAKVTREVKWKV